MTGDNKFSPGATANTVRAANGEVLKVPEGWVLLPPGDAGLTRRVKAAGEHWVVQEKKGRKTFSKGVWAPAETITRIRSELEVERSTERYAKRKAADTRRREKAQADYDDKVNRMKVETGNIRKRLLEEGEKLAKEYKAKANLNSQLAMDMIVKKFEDEVG